MNITALKALFEEAAAWQCLAKSGLTNQIKQVYTGVSINGGIPKWLVCQGKSHLEMDDLGVALFQETLM